MPVEVQKVVTTASEGPASDQISQSTAVSQIPTKTESQDASSDRGNAWIWYIVGIVDVFLLLGLVFRLFGARAVGFADFLYSVTNVLAAPFRGIFPNPSLEDSRFDTAYLVAIVVYALVGWLISRLIDLATRPSNSSRV